MISSSGVSSREGNDGIVWEEVALGPGTFTVTSENRTKYEVEERTALGALNASNATYVLDDMWYEQYGTLFISSINAFEGEGLAGWVYHVNDETPEIGANIYAVEEGDEVVFYYSKSMSAEPEDSAEAIYLKVVFENGASGGYERIVAAKGPENLKEIQDHS
ncbi:hypothetical protein J2129_001964 [Methanofollis sp. W23]|uniref:DUF4430 domain-containing protein n=1 Tax=Methanofollis sp. W23 TaxID=2817849 RepID=UPI001AE5BA96|nr:DUF4430 domain-containing protein [Methanofollis sp. W23]MBP2146510.1 hypothetical protein [Methanofollis sp. W23]